MRGHIEKGEKNMVSQNHRVKCIREERLQNYTNTKGHTYLIFLKMIRHI